MRIPIAALIGAACLVSLWPVVDFVLPNDDEGEAAARLAERAIDLEFKSGPVDYSGADCPDYDSIERGATVTCEAHVNEGGVTTDGEVAARIRSCDQPPGGGLACEFLEVPGGLERP